MNTPHFHKQQLRHEWGQITKDFPAETPIISYDNTYNGKDTWFIDIGSLTYVYHNNLEAIEDLDLLETSLKNL